MKYLFCVFTFLLVLKQSVFDTYTCISGSLGTSATIVACEAGNIDCQILTDVSTNPRIVTGSCTSTCKNAISNRYTTCYSSANNKKIGIFCFVGDMLSGSGQIPIVCNTGHFCQNTINWISASNGLIPIAINGSCNSMCTPSSKPTNPSPSTQTSIECYTSDFGNKKGSICYVGIFGTDAQIRGCALSNICKYDSSTNTGSCISPNLCVLTGTVTCYNGDYGNKQGPVCYVGQFNGAKIVNCAIGQFCARTLSSNLITRTNTFGSCETLCISSSTNFCCQTDLCNAYTPSSFAFRLNMRNELNVFLFFYFLIFEITCVQ